MLGPLQVTVGGETAEFRTDAMRVLLAYLAAHQGTPQRRDTLAGLLSPDRPDQEALTYLRNRLTLLRKAIKDAEVARPWLELDRKQIALREGADIAVDVTHFDQLLTHVERHAHRELAGCPTCLANLQEAADLVRGELLAGLNFPSDTWETWLLAQREHYRQKAVAGLALLRDAWLAQGAWAAVVPIAQRQLLWEPWLEAAHRALMQAHYHLGDRNAALAQYEQCAQRLWDELGVAPEAETEQVRQQILEDALVGGRTAVAGNLPLPTGLFFGREAEQAHLLQRLVDPHYRLITLVGTGGIGKTRLALQVAHQLQTSFPDGVWFVALEAMQGGGEQIKVAMGEAAGLAQDGKQLNGEQVLAILRDKRFLFILDNCEGVLAELGFLPEWLRRAPQIAILATSREPLNFQAESVMLVDGLPTGTTAAPSTAEALFAEQGQMAWAGFAVTAENLPQVRQICHLVAGSPLAIALAAAWVRRRSLTQIYEEIGRSLDFLTTRWRDQDPRHRSMRAVLETSWQLLAAEEQAVLAALSVFPTTFTAAAAAAVAAATPLILDSLCEKSLLQQQQEPARYGMHTLVRQFTAEKRATQPAETAVDHAFVTYFYQFAQSAQHNYPALQPEWPNLAAGIHKAHALQAWPMVLDFVQVLDEAWFRQIRFDEMRTALLMAVEAAEALPQPTAVARLQLRLGQVELEQSQYEAAESHLNHALTHFRRLEDGWGMAHTHYFLSRLKLEQAADDEAILLSEASKQMFEEQDDWLGIAKNLNLLALCQIKKYRDFDTAHAYLEESVALQKRVPLTANYIETLRHLARVKSMAEAYGAAAACLAEAARVSAEQGDLGEATAVLYEQLLLCKQQNQLDQALSFGYACLEGFQKLGSLRWEALIKTQLGLLHQGQENHAQAAVLLNEGLQIFSELDDRYEQAYSYYYLAKLYAQMGDTAHSHAAKREAHQLNQKLNDPLLTQRLEADS